MKNLMQALVVGAAIVSGTECAHGAVYGTASVGWSPMQPNVVISCATVGTSYTDMLAYPAGLETMCYSGSPISAEIIFWNRCTWPSGYAGGPFICGTQRTYPIQQSGFYGVQSLHWAIPSGGTGTFLGDHSKSRYCEPPYPYGPNFYANCSSETGY